MATRNPGGFLPTALGPIRLKANGVEVSPRATIDWRGVVHSDDGSTMTLAFPDSLLTTDNSDAPQLTTEATVVGNTPTTIGATFSIPEGRFIRVNVQGLVVRDGASRGEVFDIERLIKNYGGTVAASTQEALKTPANVGGSTGCDIQIEYTGTTGRIEFTGVAATTHRVRIDRQLTYLDAPDPAIVVTAISPNTGTASGGTSVSITVDDSTGATGATVGGVALTGFAIVDGTHVSGTTGAHAAGAVDVVVTNAEGSGTLAGGFTYTAAAFDPLTLPEASATPLLWLDPTDCTNTGNGTDVTAVVDKASGSMTIGLTGNEPTFNSSNADYDGAPTFDCGSAQGFLLSTTGLTTTAFTAVLVCDGQDGVWFQDGNGNYLVNAGGGSGDKAQMTSAAGPYLASTTATSTVPGVYVFVFNGASSLIYTSAETPSASGDAGTLSSLSGVTIGLLGTYNMSGAGLQGSCRHALIYDGAMSANDVAYLLNGFGDESGITIGA